MTAERTVDVLVIGSGVAGLSVAVGVTPARSVLLASREPGGGGGSTSWAQGGIATVVDFEDDPANHAADTSVAGADLCDPDALDVLVQEGPARVAELITAGAGFDRNADGRLLTGLEGGHHHSRIVHAGGDATGAEVARTLDTAAAAAGIERVYGARATALLVADGRVVGADLATPEGAVRVHARAVVLATGGLGNVYPSSTNPATVGGDGIALALRAGAALTDMEFVQFHPTVLYTGNPSGQLPLVTEAVRGAGAVLRDAAGRAFMAGRHPLADLAPRDVVARAVQAAMAADGRPHVWLDARAVDAEEFPTVARACREIGVDLGRDLVPVAAAQHFLCGGIATDTWGRTSAPGLWAVGETAATGVHGANRLASNSMLEGLVFGRRAAARLVLDLPAPHPGAATALDLADLPAAADVARAAVGAHAGLTRDASGLADAAAALAGAPGEARRDPTWLTASAIVAAATLRRESRGTHYRADFPESSPDWRRRITVVLDDDGTPVASGNPEPVGHRAA